MKNGMAGWRMLCGLAFLLLLLPWLAQPGAAGEVYRWQDANGTWHFSDRRPPGTPVRAQRTESASERRESIPLARSGRGKSYLVQATINDVMKLRFIVDTGAGTLLLPVERYQALKNMGALSEADEMGSSIYSFADGNKARHRNIRLKSLKVGSRTLHDVQAAVGNPNTEPLMGISILERLGSWRIDDANSRLILEPRHAAARNEAQSRAQSSAAASICRYKQINLETDIRNLKELAAFQKRAWTDIKTETDEVQSASDKIAEMRKMRGGRGDMGRRKWNEMIRTHNQRVQEVNAAVTTYNRYSEQRSHRFNILLKQYKERVEIFNKECPTLLYKEPAGSWKMFPEYAVPKVE